MGDFKYINKIAKPFIHDENDDKRKADLEKPSGTEVFLMTEKANSLLNLFKWRAGIPYGIRGS